MKVNFKIEENEVGFKKKLWMLLTGLFKNLKVNLI